MAGLVRTDQLGRDYGQEHGERCSNLFTYVAAMLDIFIMLYMVISDSGGRLMIMQRNGSHHKASIRI